MARAKLLKCLAGRSQDCWRRHDLTQVGTMSAVGNGPRLPNLFIVGAPKCGTTAWVEYLRTHPDIFFPVIKEPHYFSPDIPKPKGFNNFPTEDRYLALFAQSGDAPIVGEGSVRYLQSQEAARNIREFNCDAKIIIFVRDQQDYLPSLHNQLVF